MPALLHATPTRRAALALLASTALPALATDAPWTPSKPEFIVPSGAGAALDSAARKLTELLAREGLTESFVVSNRSGAHSIQALEILQRQPGNANVLMTLSSGYVTSVAQGALPPRLQEFTPLATLVREFTTVVVRADSPVRNAQDLIATLRRDPGSLSIGIATTLGNHIHLGIAQPLKQAGVPVQGLRVVPYKSSAESMTALVGGHLDVVSATTPNLLPYLQAQRVRVIAIAADQRLAGAFADAPTWKEQGVDYVSDSFQGVMTTARITPAQQRFWVQALQRVAQSADWQAFVALNQWKPHFLGPEETQAALRRQIAQTQALLGELNLQPSDATAPVQAAAR
ncbi:tripartite tricarboxylate transporter substrate binding protein [Pseudorhodoferax sp.]|uniref:tripartite tricarboxylate transporter substrate binding protein n=1 Tax=Pseudorhodoferax sp. TaxID=1993553 RepID=UPI002DD646C7|nr:tripartite tricarboxylate transporter substrate binding protein [Pseudorhodoferax sp.]